jgi:nitroreductase
MDFEAHIRGIDYPVPLMQADRTINGALANEKLDRSILSLSSTGKYNNTRSLHGTHQSHLHAPIDWKGPPGPYSTRIDRTDSGRSRNCSQPSPFTALAFRRVDGNARLRLGELMTQSVLKRNADASSEQLATERRKPLRGPVLIAVGVDKPGQNRITEMDNICACAAAVENLLLTAHDLGLGAIWKTGGAVEDADIKTFLGFEPDQHVIAIVYIGYPENESAQPVRPPAADRTRWLEE